MLTARCSIVMLAAGVTALSASVIRAAHVASCCDSGSFTCCSMCHLSRVCPLHRPGLQAHEVLHLLPLMPHGFTTQQSGFRAKQQTGLTLAIIAGLLSYPYPISTVCLLLGTAVLRTCHSLLLLVVQISPSPQLLPPTECLRLHCPPKSCIHHR